MTRGARYHLLAIVYTSQFVPLAFLLYGLSAVLREREVPLEQIALVQLLGLVWVVKFAWAPWSTATAHHGLVTTAAGCWESRRC